MIREMFLRDFSWWGVAWQSTLFAIIGLAGSFFLRRRPARSCQLLFLAVIAAVLVPTMSILVKHFEMGLLAIEPSVLAPDGPDEVTVSLYEVPVALPRTDIPDEAPAGISEPAGTKTASGSINVPWRAIAMYVWMAATFILMGRLLVAFVGGIRLLRAAQLCGCEQIRRAADSARARLGMVMGLQIRSSEGLRSPVIWCWSRPPVLLVPADLNCAVDWVGVISHEIAHCKRWDHLSGLMAELVVCILPWNPLLWWCKKRMVRLSEQACDDWVVEGGQPGTEYAQSLLNLSPEVQMAFLPTVIGKEKPMKERICRIVREKCGEPRVGAGWALAVTVIAMSLAVGVAFAQERPAAREPRGDMERLEARQEQAPERAMIAGRRNVLTRLLDQLHNQVRETEAALRERGDQPGEEGRVLGAELQALHEQIAIVERQLGALEGGPRRPTEAVPGSPEREARLNDLRRHRDELVENARHVERELEGLRDGQDAEARELKAQLEQIHTEMREVEKQLVAYQRVEGRARILRPTPSQPQVRPENVRQRRAELAEETRRVEERLREIRPDQDQEARELKTRLEQLHAEMAEIDNRSPDIRRVQGQIEQVRADAEPRPRTAPAGNPRLEAQVEELRNQMLELREQMQQMQRLMEQAAARDRAREGAGEPERR